MIVVTILLVAPEKSSNEFVWFHYNNETGMPNVVYVCVIGLLMPLFSFSGYESGAHMAEETTNASKSAPLGILYTCIATMFTGFFYIMGLLYALNNDIPSVMADDGEYNISDQVVANIFQKTFSNGPKNLNKAGALALTGMLIVNLFFAGFSSLTVTSRIGYAMARDGAFPCSNFLRYINPSTKTPVTNIFFVFVLIALLCLLPLISTTAFSAITGITTIGC